MTITSTPGRRSLVRASRSCGTASTMGTMQVSDSPEPVPVQHERVAADLQQVAPAPEAAFRLGVEHSVEDRVGDDDAEGERGVQAQPGVGPLDALVELVVDEPLDPRVADRDEPRGGGAVVRDHPFVDREDVHAPPSSMVRPAPHVGAQARYR